jgi:hypothetical protein
VAANSLLFTTLGDSGSEQCDLAVALPSFELPFLDAASSNLSSNDKSWRANLNIEHPAAPTTKLLLVALPIWSHAI